MSVLHLAFIRLIQIDCSKGFLLTGLPPFRGTAMDLIESKQNGEIEFEVAIPSRPAQNLVRGLLKVRPSERLTIEQVLNHEWMIEADDFLERFELDVAYAFLKDWKRI
jgi:serine/threonine protein kinase